MFTIGLEFDVSLIKKRLRSALSISAAGIIAPFCLGGAIALYLYARPEFFASEATRPEAILFMGASMSITAFPMLARIIYERGLAGTSLGTLALAAGSMDDAAAWCVLAVVLASFADNPDLRRHRDRRRHRLRRWSLMLIGRPLLARLGERVEREGSMSNGVLAVVLMPRHARRLVHRLHPHLRRVRRVHHGHRHAARHVCHERSERQIGPLTTTFLLPLFFVYSGLNTRIGLVNTPALWRLVAARHARRDHAARASPAGLAARSTASRTARRWRSAR